MSGIPSQFDPLGKSLLPAGYKRVNYLESTGTQWIDTGVDCTSDIGVEFIT